MALLTSAPQECLARLARLRRRALRSKERNDAVGLLALMVRAARTSNDCLLALRLSQRLVREDPNRSSWWSTLALAELEYALSKNTSSSIAKKYFRRATAHYGMAAATEEAAPDRDVAMIEVYRRAESNVLDRLRRLGEGHSN